MTDIKEIVFSIIQRIAPEADLDELEPDENLQEALDIDSYDFLSLLIGVDEALGVEVPEAAYTEVMTLNSMLAYLKARIPQAQ